MTLKIQYWAMLNAIKAKTLEVTALSNRVIIGERTTLLEYPCGFVVPARDAIEYETTGYAMHRPGVRIVIMTQGMDPEATLTEALNIACDVYDLFTLDPKLGGTVEWMYPISFSPDFSIGISKTLSWVVLEYQANLVLDP